MNDTPNPGGLYRFNYLRPSVPLDDSPIARRRLLALFMTLTDERLREAFVDLVRLRLGVIHHGTQYRFHKLFWEGEQIGNVLSAITLWYGLVKDRSDRALIVDQVEMIFDEEHLNYRMAPEGGIHPRVDDLFERDRIATITGLEAQRFNGARVALQKAFAHLKAEQPSGKGLIREVFEAVESTYLVVIANPRVDRLNGQTIAGDLKPKLLSRYASFGDAEDKVERLLVQFSDWVKTAHPYRHGTAAEREHEAPVDLAVLMASQGMAFIRFLAAL